MTSRNDPTPGWVARKDSRMTEIDYVAAAVSVRADLTLSHNQIVEHVTTPGTWWTGPERRAIAEEARAARTCRLCVDRKAALSPFSVDGHHDGPGDLDPRTVDVIHRAITDPGRLTRSWYESVITEGGLDPERYVELISVAILLNALDVFSRAVGVEPASLPEPEPGEPTKQRPKDADVDQAWVPRLPPAQADSPEWRALYGERTQVAEVERALSLVPAEIHCLNRTAETHYMAFRHVPDPHYSHPDRALSRAQTELVASRVSLINECFY